MKYNAYYQFGEDPPQQCATNIGKEFGVILHTPSDESSVISGDVAQSFSFVSPEGEEFKLFLKAEEDTTV